MPFIGMRGTASVFGFGRGRSGSGTIPPGEAVYTTPGTYTWTAPAGVTFVSVVAIGGGAAGNKSGCCYGGSGGSLGYKNNIAVSPGSSYTVVVGKGGTYDGSCAANSTVNGSHSYFINTSTVRGGGGVWYQAAVTYVGDGGGNPIAPGYCYGTGAGGYSGITGGNNSPYNSAAGGGADGGGSVQGHGAGGTGLYGMGASGIYSASNGGAGGSGGSKGGDSCNNGGNCNGGIYGGGGGGADSGCCAGSSGGKGAVRIIWGNSPVRSFPNAAA